MAFQKQLYTSKKLYTKDSKVDFSDKQTQVLKKENKRL